MEIGQILELTLKYALVPLFTVVWYMFKKQDGRIEMLEKRTTDNEKTLIEIRTEFKYISQDIAEIKKMIEKLADR